LWLFVLQLYLPLLVQLQLVAMAGAERLRVTTGTQA
jgi:hypothetical protein